MYKRQDLQYQTAGAYATNRVLKKFYNASDKKLDISYTTKDYLPIKLNSGLVDCNDFYYYDHNELHKIYEENNYEDAVKNCIGIHWFGGSPTSQEANNKISIENYKDINSTVCTAIKNILEER